MGWNTVFNSDATWENSVGGSEARGSERWQEGLSNEPKVSIKNGEFLR